MKSFLIHHEMILATIVVVLFYAVCFCYPPYNMPVFYSLQMFIVAMAYLGTYATERIFHEAKSKHPYFVLRMFYRSVLFIFAMLAETVRNAAADISI